MELYELQFWIHLTDRFIKRKLILTRQNEKKVAELMNEEFEEGTYTIQI